MKEWLERACEDIDAGFFSGDGFHSREVLEEIREYLGRWERQCKVIDEMLDEEAEKEKENENEI